MKQILFLSLFLLTTLLNPFCLLAQAPLVSNLRVVCYDQDSQFRNNNSNTASIKFKWDRSPGIISQYIWFINSDTQTFLGGGFISTNTDTWTYVDNSTGYMSSGFTQQDALPYTGQNLSIIILGKGSNGWTSDELNFNLSEDEIHKSNLYWGWPWGFFKDGGPDSSHGSYTSCFDATRCIRLKNDGYTFTKRFDASNYVGVVFGMYARTWGVSGGFSWDIAPLTTDDDFVTTVYTQSAQWLPEINNFVSTAFNNCNMGTEFLHDEFNFRVRSFKPAGASGYLFIDNPIIRGIKVNEINNVNKTGNIPTELSAQVKKLLSSNKALSFNFYPNPANDKIHLSFEESNPSGTISILSFEGKELMKLEVNKSKVDLDLTKFAKGIYLLRFESGDNSSVKKLMID